MLGHHGPGPQVLGLLGVALEAIVLEHGLDTVWTQHPIHLRDLLEPCSIARVLQFEVGGLLWAVEVGLVA